MFIIALTYTAPLEQVEQHLAAHREFWTNTTKAAHSCFRGAKNRVTAALSLPVPQAAPR